MTVVPGQLIFNQKQAAAMVGGQALLLRLEREFGLRPIERGNRRTTYHLRDIENAAERYRAECQARRRMPVG